MLHVMVMSAVSALWFRENMFPVTGHISAAFAIKYKNKWSTKP